MYCPVERARTMASDGHRFECEDCEREATQVVVVVDNCAGEMKWSFSCDQHEEDIRGMLHEEMLEPCNGRPFHQCGAYGIVAVESDHFHK